MSLRLVSALAVAFVLAMASPSRAALDSDDKKWLQDVKPLLLDREQKILESLKSRDDRLEFRKIFWARRDPDLFTEENEFRKVYDARKPIADKRYFLGTNLRVPKHTDKLEINPGSATGERELMEQIELRQYRDMKERDEMPGSLTDCGLVFLIFGEPDDIQKRTHTVWGSREPQSWTYGKYANSRFLFDEACAMPPGHDKVRVALQEQAIVQPGIDYHVKGGELIKKLADMMPKPSPMYDLLRAGSRDFALATQSLFLKTPDATALFGLVKGDGSALFREGANGRCVRVRLRVEAHPQVGQAVASERETIAELDAGGSFVVSYRLAVKPGPHALKVAVLDANSPKGSVLDEPLDVPDFDKDETTIGSIMALENVETATRDPKHPYAAFVIGDSQFVPRFGNVFRPSESITLSYQFYAPEGPAAPKPNASAKIRILHPAGNPIAETAEETFDTPVAGTIVGPVALARYRPGTYKVELRIKDASGKDYTQQTTFEVREDAAN
jgi:hypothetical protein